MSEINIDTNELDPRDAVRIRLDTGVVLSGAINDAIKREIPSFRDKTFSVSQADKEDNYKRHYTQRIDILHEGAQLLFSAHNSLTNETKNRLIQIANQYKEPLSENRDTCQTALAHYTKELIKFTQNKFKVDKSQATEMLDRAECYAAVEQGTSSLVTVSNINDKVVIQIEETIPSLEGDLLTEYWDIKQGNYPEWYKQLSDTETSLLDHLLDQATDKTALKRLFMTLPSKLRSIPIPANLRRHHSITLDKYDNRVLMHSQRLRSSNISSNDVRGASKTIRRKHAKSNMKAILAQKPNAKIALFQTLTSPVKTKLIPEYTMYQDQLAARDELTDVKIPILVTNHPINLVRVLFRGSKANPQLVKLANKHVAKSPLLKAALKQYQDKSHKTANSYNLYMASLEQIIVEEMGGICHSACKSSKDRKGLETLHTDSLRLFFSMTDRLPKGVDDRKQFCKVFAQLFVSRHQQEAAGQNTPGCNGMLNPKGVLPKDLIKMISSRPEWKKILDDSPYLGKNNRIPNIIKRKYDDTAVVKIINKILMKDKYWKKAGKHGNRPKGVNSMYKIVNPKTIFSARKPVKLSDLVQAADNALSKHSPDRAPSTSDFYKMFNEYKQTKNINALMTNLVKFVRSMEKEPRRAKRVRVRPRPNR